MHDIPWLKDQTPAVNTPRNNLDPHHGWGIRARDQITVAVITTIAIAAIAASWIYRGGLRDRMIDIETAPSVQVKFQIDINRADWPEWTLLPGVGETMAKKIVLHRSERGLFRSHADLLRVSGVGPRTFERMRPYLLPLPEGEDRLEQEVAARE